MDITSPDARRTQPPAKNYQRNIENDERGLGTSSFEGFPVRDVEDTVFRSDSERGDQAGTWITSGGQATLGGIYRRLKEIHQSCLTLIESQQRQLEISLQDSKQITTEILYLQTLLAETLDKEAEE